MIGLYTNTAKILHGFSDAKESLIRQLVKIPETNQHHCFL